MIRIVILMFVTTGCWRSGVGRGGGGGALQDQWLEVSLGFRCSRLTEAAILLAKLKRPANPNYG